MEVVFVYGNYAMYSIYVRTFCLRNQCEAWNEILY